MPAKLKKPVAKILSAYELMQKFPNEQSAIDDLEEILWADDEIRCPYPSRFFGSLLSRVWHYPHL